jgi:hypothetical protein
VTDAPAQMSSALAERYRIIRELGAGGMATVCLAEACAMTGASRSKYCGPSSPP